ncbi:MAG: hypothetical protein KBS59_05095 [Clostridiales bacterium]|nr:hypothetical protein [Clostridiales bacterium]
MPIPEIFDREALKKEILEMRSKIIALGKNDEKNPVDYGTFLSSEADIERLVNDDARVELYLKTKEVVEKTKRVENAFARNNVYIRDNYKNVARVIKYMHKDESIPGNAEFNEALAERVLNADETGKAEFVRDVMENLIKMDFKKPLAILHSVSAAKHESKEAEYARQIEIAEYYSEHMADVEAGFTIVSTEADAKQFISLDESFVVKNVKQIYEGLSIFKSQTMLNGSILGFLTDPTKDAIKNDPQILGSVHDMYGKINVASFIAEDKEYWKEINDVSDCLSDTLLDSTDKMYEFSDKVAENGYVFTTPYDYIAKKDGKEVSVFDTIMNSDPDAELIRAMYGNEYVVDTTPHLSTIIYTIKGKSPLKENIDEQDKERVKEYFNKLLPQNDDLSPKERKNAIAGLLYVSQMHFSREKPSFLSRFFRTSAARKYAEERIIMNKYSDILKKNGINENVLKEITTRETFNGSMISNEYAKNAFKVHELDTDVLEQNATSSAQKNNILTNSIENEQREKAGEYFIGGNIDIREHLDFKNYDNDNNQLEKDGKEYNEVEIADQPFTEDDLDVKLVEIYPGEYKNGVSKEEQEDFLSDLDGDIKESDLQNEVPAIDEANKNIINLEHVGP